MVSSFYEQKNLQAGLQQQQQKYISSVVHERKKKKMSIDSNETSTMHAKQEENTECVLGKQKTKCSSQSKRNGCSNNKNVIVASIIAIIFITKQNAVDASPSKDVQPSVRINKCCEKFEIYVDSRCTTASEVNASK